MTTPHPDRLPPALASYDAETSLLGSCFVDPTVFPAVRERLTADDFAWPAHAAWWTTLGEMADAPDSPPLDSIATVVAALRGAGRMEAVGGEAHAHAAYCLLVDMSSPWHAAHHAGLVRAASRRRAVHAVGAALAAAAADGGRDVADLARDAAGALLPVAAGDDGRGGSEGFRPAREGLWAVMEQIEARAAARRDGRTLGVATGYPELDRLFHGWRPGELIVVGAGPKMGKSTLALNILAHHAEAGHHGGVVSCEMTRDELVEGLLARASGIPRQHLGGGVLRDDDWPRLARHASLLAPVLERVHVYDATFPTLADVVARATALKHAHPEATFLVVDYLQLVTHRLHGRRGDEEIAAVAAGLKSLAKRLGVVILAPVQVNYKDTDRRESKRPTLADIQGSSGPAQAANVVLLLYRPAVYEMRDDDVLEVEIAASRRTDRATVVLGWDGARMRVTSRERGPVLARAA